MLMRCAFLLILFPTSISVAANAGPSAQSVLVKSLLWNVLLEAHVDNTDFTTSSVLSEYTSYPGIGQIFYVPAVSDSSQANTTLYRLIHPSNPLDHMDSTDQHEGSQFGYTMEGPLGYPYTSSSALPSLAPICRFSNGSDHLTSFCSYTYPGYTNNGSLGVYGFMRYLTNPSELQAYAAGGVTEQSDLVAGGAVASWQWNGTQFIDTSDYGRYMQAAFFFPDTPQNIGNTAPSVNFNPTEAGDQYDPPPNSPLPATTFTHGSPAVFAQVSSNVHQTRSIPAEYEDSSMGATSTQVILYNTTEIGKDLYLNWNGMGPVALYVTHFILPISLTLNEGEVPTAYLQETYNNFYTYDLSTGEISSPLGPTSNTCSSGEVRWSPTFTSGAVAGSKGYGGIIISDSTHNFAMGAYAVIPYRPSVPAGGGFGMPGFVLDNFLTCGHEASKWSVSTGTVTLPQGDNTFHTYIITGTLAQVEANMRTLYAMNAQ